MATAEPGKTKTGDETIRANVRALLRVRKQTQAALARHMGWDEGTMSKVMNGGRRFWAAQLLTVAEFFDVDVGVLFASTPEELAQGVGLTLPQLLEDLKTPCFDQPQLWPVAVKDAS